MIIFVIISVVVPLFFYFVFPQIFQAITHKPKPSRWFLLVGGVLFFISWYLPSPLIHGQFTAFNTHLVGGGMFTGFLWLYIKKHLRVQLSPAYDLIALYALVSTLGVTNELWELWVTEYTSIKISSFDVWWDLLANTLGALTVWIGYSLARVIKKAK